MRTLLASLVVATALAVALPAGLAAQATRAPDTKSKNPPPGAPWKRDFLAAHAAAVDAGLPIFVYSTKTY